MNKHYRVFVVFTNPITGTHVVGEPDGPPVAKFKPEQKKEAEAEAERRTKVARDAATAPGVDGVVGGPNG